MSKTPDFHRIAATITDRDIDDFYRSAAPGDFKQQVREAPDDETKKRFVAGYLIRTKQIKPERLNPKTKKTATKKTTTKTPVAKRGRAPRVKHPSRSLDRLYPRSLPFDGRVRTVKGGEVGRVRIVFRTGLV